MDKESRPPQRQMPPGEPPPGEVPVAPVNHNAGLDPDFDPGAGQPPPDDPYSDAMAIRGLFGAVHNDLAQLNEHLVSESSGLRSKNVDKNVMDRDILQVMGQNPQQPQLQPQPQPGQVAHHVHPQAPHQAPVQQPATTQHDPNQIEFNFDNSATAQDIFNRLSDIERDQTKILRLLNGIKDSLATNEKN